MPMHDGHRQRLKDRFRKEGLDNFSEVNALELMLFYCVPRQDTNPLAHRLLDHFGTFAQVLDAPPEELEKVPGAGANVATFLSLMTNAWRYYMVNRSMQNLILTTAEMCGDYLMSHFYGRMNETVFILCLDAKCKVLCCKELGEGSVNMAAISTRKVVETAIGVNASSVVLAHNHPSGLAIPSDADKQTTRQIAFALQAVDIKLVDHIIVADEDYVSMAQSGYFTPGEQCILV